MHENGVDILQVRWLSLFHPAAMAFALVLASTWAQAIQVQITTSVDRSVQPTISGACNLPDGTLLIVRINRKESAYQFEGRVEVQDGKFKVGPLTQGAWNLNPGVYSIVILSVPMSEQPEAVRGELGKKGEELRGPLTKRAGGETQVRLLSTLDIGGPSNPDQDLARRQQVELSQTRWWRKNCTDICTGGERYAQQKGESFDRPACFNKCVANPPSVVR